MINPMTDTTPVFDRLAQGARDHLQQQLLMRNDTASNGIDPLTGRPYFHPQTGRSPKNRSNDVKSNIGDHLYSYHRQIEEKH
jgi:hypothetical protein